MSNVFKQLFTFMLLCFLLTLPGLAFAGAVEGGDTGAAAGKTAVAKPARKTKPSTNGAPLDEPLAEEEKLEHTYDDNCPLCHRESIKRYMETKLEEFKTEQPYIYAFAGEANVRKFISMSLEKGKKHELYADREVNAIRIMMLHLGCDFDQDPMYPWARLKTFPPKDYKDESPPSWAFIRKVYAEFYDFYNKTTGEEYAHLLAAAKRVMALSFQDVAAIRSEGQILDMMAHLYPERYAAIPGEALAGPVMRAAEKMAEAHHLDPNTGKVIFAGLIFLYGISVDTDPLHANIFDGLGDEYPHMVKEQALFARLQNLVKQELKAAGVRY